MVDEDTAHHLRRHAEELGAILPVDRVLIGEAQVGLVHERRRLQGVAAALAAQVGRGPASQVLVDDGDEAIRRLRLAGRPGGQESRDVSALRHWQTYPTPPWRRFP